MRPKDGRAIPAFITQALAGEPITVHGDGSQSRSICFVDDLVEGIVRMLHSDLEGPVNLGNPHEVTMLELAEWIRDLAGSTSEIVFTASDRGRPHRPSARHHLGEDGPGLAAADAHRGRAGTTTIDWFRAHPRVTAVALARTAMPGGLP